MTEVRSSRENKMHNFDRYKSSGLPDYAMQMSCGNLYDKFYSVLKCVFAAS